MEIAVRHTDTETANGHENYEQEEAKDEVRREKLWYAPLMPHASEHAKRLA